MTTFLPQTLFLSFSFLYLVLETGQFFPPGVFLYQITLKQKAKQEPIPLKKYSTAKVSVMDLVAFL